MITKRTDPVRPTLADGTLVRHKTAGYVGRIQGVTGIQACFTSRGAPLRKSDEQFQYRVVVSGEILRRIAPADDLEIVKEEVKTETPPSTPPHPRKPTGKRKCKSVRHFI